MYRRNIAISPCEQRVSPHRRRLARRDDRTRKNRTIATLI